MKVYVVYHSYMPTLEAIFATRDGAEKFADELAKKWSSIQISEYEVQE